MHLSEEEDAGDDEDQDFLILGDRMKAMSVSGDSQYFGKSSNTMLVHTAMETKNFYSGQRTDRPSFVSPERACLWKPRPVCQLRSYASYVSH
jgi:hypothetical protein